MSSSAIRSWVLVACAAVSIMSTGCNNSEEAPQKPATAFQGQVDDRFVGSWKSTTSKYTFNKDGSYLIESHINTPGGPMDTKSHGKWLVDKDRFLIQDEKGNVVPYTVTVNGNRMSLGLTGSMKTTTELTKQ